MCLVEPLDPVVVRVGTSPGALGSLLELVVNFQHAAVQKLTKSFQPNKQQEVKHDKQVLRCGLFNLSETFSTQDEQSDLDSQFADIQAAMEAYLSAATKLIANALRCVVIP